MRELGADGLRKKSGPGGTGGLNPRRPYAPQRPGIGAVEGAGPKGNVRALGLGGKAFTAAGRAVDVEYQVVELGSLIPTA